MAIKTFTTGEVLTASDTNTYLNNGGLVYITQTAYSASSAVNVDNCFTSTYQNYVLVNSCTGSGSSNVRLKYRASGTTDSSNLYYTQGLYPNNNATGYIYDWPVTTGHFLGNFTGTATYPGTQTIQIWNPKNAVRTAIWVQWEVTDSGLGGFNNGMFAADTAFDGFALIPAAGTITGTVRVYGYRQA
jgi:hypothetical protein